MPIIINHHDSTRASAGWHPGTNDTWELDDGFDKLAKIIKYSEVKSIAVDGSELLFIRDNFHNLPIASYKGKFKRSIWHGDLAQFIIATMADHFTKM